MQTKVYITKDQVLELIGELASFVKIDANTYLWAKSQPTFAKEKTENTNSKYDMGGGNFTIALSSLSFLSLLAKLFEIMNHPNDCTNLFWDDNKPRFKDETSAVKKLMNEVNSHLHIIDDIKHTQAFWKLMRHGLAHCYIPKGGNSTLRAIDHLEFKTTLNYYDYVNRLQESIDPAIWKNKRGGFDVNSDQLAVRVHKVSEWVSAYIRNTEITDSQRECIDNLFS